MSSIFKPQLGMPGFNLPLNHEPEKNISRKGIRGFPNALDEDHIEYGCFNNLLTHREILMMRVMNAITDKPDWDRKVFDKEITSKWREEVAQSGQDVTRRMMNYIIKELKWKSEIFQKTGFVQAFDAGVVKSDTAISKELQQDLKQAVLPLEDVSQNQRDYHPGSDDKVIDLVHPSLFPVIFGHTRVLPDKTIGIDDCLDNAGQGELLSIPSKEEVTHAKRGMPWSAEMSLMSQKFQWLPCEIELTEDSGCRIVSYINNAHPVKHRDLYSVVEKILARTIPLWNKSLTAKPYGQARIQYETVEYGEPTRPRPTWAGDKGPNYAEDEGKEGKQKEEDGDEEEDLGDDSDEDKKEDEELDEELYYQRLNEWENSRPILRPEPGKFEIMDDESERVNLQRQFPNRNLQVIVKLANIELAPEKPEYEGGSWHLEGALNERICATAIYYYDSENITESHLAFRQRGTYEWLNLGYEQDRHGFLQEVYGFGPEVTGRNDTQATQDLGNVLCREGRLLTFPNTIQHRVSPFSLADPSRPGHRKILALFLVDPHRRIISSANVPPQRKDWVSDSHGSVKRFLSERLTPEVQHRVEDLLGSFMTMDEAKKQRLALMEERSVNGKQENQNFEIADFSLCEH